MEMDNTLTGGRSYKQKMEIRNEKENFCGCNDPLPAGGNERFCAGSAGSEDKGTPHGRTDGPAQDRPHGRKTEPQRGSVEAALRTQPAGSKGYAGAARTDARRPQGQGREDAKAPYARAVRAVEADAGPEARHGAWPADEGWKGMRLQGRQEM